MALSEERREQIEFIIRGAAKVWGIVLLIAVPLAVLIAITVFIGHHSQTVAILFIYSILFTVFGGYYGYTEYEWQQREKERKQREIKRAAEAAAMKKEWDEKSAALRRPWQTGTGN